MCPPPPGSSDYVQVSIQESEAAAKKSTQNDAIRQVIAKHGKQKTDGSGNVMTRLFSLLQWDKLIKRQKKAVSVGEMFRYSNRKEKIIFGLGILSALLNALPMPIMLIIYGRTTDTFVLTSFCQVMQMYNISEYCPPNVDAGNINQLFMLCNWTGTDVQIPQLSVNVSMQSLYFVIIGITSCIFSWGQASFLANACERITLSVRLEFFRAILRKPVRWFDLHDPGMINHELTETVSKYKHGVGDKVGVIAQSVLTGVVSLIIILVIDWKLSLVLLSISPVLIMVTSYMTIAAGQSTTLETAAYSRAGSIAQQTFANIRTVHALNGVDVVKDKYVGNLEEAKTEAVKKGKLNALMLSMLWLTMFLSYALGFWYGSKLIADGTTIGKVLIVYFGIQTIVFGLGGSIPHYSAFTEARSAANTIYESIDDDVDEDAPVIVGRLPSGSANDLGGESKNLRQPGQDNKNHWVDGDIEFQNVSFAYPSRPEVKVLDEFSFRFARGKKTAIVGESGCGKSTIVQLILKFYNTSSGVITYGGKPINDINVTELRSEIGLVGQEPVLFSTTIEENIKFGKADTTDVEVKAVCQLANATEFIESFPQKYQTLVGESGSQLSGGQKQRIAIARALISNPALLLLDEATSALDSESERIVQQALDVASKGRTTIIIAHRLSTIRNADYIIGMKEGRIVESGTHDELMSRPGVYKFLVESQSKHEMDDLSSHTADDQAATQPMKQRLATLETGSRLELCSSTQDNGAVEDTKAPKPTTTPLMTVLKYMLAMNRPETLIIALACVACLVTGLMQTSFQIAFARVLVLFGHCDPNERQRKINVMILVFVGIAIVSFFSQGISTWSFTVSGETLTKRLRMMVFEKLVRREISYFDDDANSTGALCATLSSEASAVQGATGIRIGSLLTGFSILFVGIIVSFVVGWQLSLVILAFVPVMIGAGTLSMKFIAGFDAKDKPILEKASTVVMESTSNIRTVKQLKMENYCFNKYMNTMMSVHSRNLRNTVVTGFLFGASQGIIFFAIAVTFYAAATFIDAGLMTTEDMMIVFGCLLFGAMAVGQTQALTPDFGKSSSAATKIYNIIHQDSEIDSNSVEGMRLEDVQGILKFDDVTFCYPTRKETKVLKDISVEFPFDMSSALVGSSGCGKSTIIQLIERFYDPTSGHLTLDGVDIRGLNIKWYRNLLGIVSQEPVLFDWSIADNIKFGDTSRVVTMEEIRKAAKTCNIDGFVVSLPEGYDTMCGTKGSRMSGGQKQRICIARALVRNPRILLLDEATSALDTESEKIVQDALDAAQDNRGSISVAHRLTTIQSSDAIHVLNAGRIEESGTHEDLLKNKEGLYTGLYSLSKR